MVHPQTICFVITKGNWGGAQRYVYDLATNLPPTDFTPMVIMGQEGEALAQKLSQAQIPSQKLSQLGRDINPVADIKTWWQLYRFFRRTQPDIVHLNSSKIGLLGALAGRLAGTKKIIFTVHGWAFNEFRPRHHQAIFKVIYWLTILLADKTIAVSEELKTEVAHWPWIKKKITVIHNGCAPLQFLERSPARAALGHLAWGKQIDLASLNQATVIGTIAELHHNKGLDYLLAAIDELKDKLGETLVWIIGQGEQAEKLKQLTKDYGLTDRVVFFGHLDNAAQYLRAFDIFVLPSRTEALGYSLLEAGQAGLPVIASAVGGIPEIISDFKLGILVRPGNIKELKLALGRLLDHPEERAKFGERLAKKVNKDFGLNKMVFLTEKIYLS